MKTLTFTFDGHDYHIANADDGQNGPRGGDTVVDDYGHEVCSLYFDGEYFIAESDGGTSIVHENEPDAAWVAVKSAIVALY